MRSLLAATISTILALVLTLLSTEALAFAGIPRDGWMGTLLFGSFLTIILHFIQRQARQARGN